MGRSRQSKHQMHARKLRNIDMCKFLQNVERFLQRLPKIPVPNESADVVKLLSKTARECSLFSIDNISDFRRGSEPIGAQTGDWSGRNAILGDSNIFTVALKTIVPCRARDYHDLENCLLTLRLEKNGINSWTWQCLSFSWVLGMQVSNPTEFSDYVLGHHGPSILDRMYENCLPQLGDSQQPTTTSSIDM